MAGKGLCSSHTLWSAYHPQHERPSAVVLQSICVHAPLRSISNAPSAAVPEHLQRTSTVSAPRTPAEVLLLDQAQQQQQQMLEQLMHAPAAVVQQDAAAKQPVQDQQQHHSYALPPPLQQLVAAAKQRAHLPPLQLQAMLQQLLPYLPALPPEQLALAAKTAAALPGAAAAVADTPTWQQALLAAASSHFAAGHMAQRPSYVLLDALVKLDVRPGAAWLHSACAGMQLAHWYDGRALSTVAACLPRLGHAPSSTWACAYFAATADKLQEFPAISLARMLHAVVAWRHLQQQQQQQQQQQEEEGDYHQGMQGRQQQQQQQLVLPEQWLCSVLQRLHACSSELKACEMAMVVQALQRLQQPGLLPRSNRQNSASLSSNRTPGALQSAAGQEPESLLQVSAQQLLHALLPAVVRCKQQFGPQDFAVVLHSVALMQQQAQASTEGQLLQHTQQLCGVDWLQQVLGATQERLFAASARTQTTTLWAVAVLLEPHLQHASQQQSNQQQQVLQQQQLTHQQQEQEQQEVLRQIDTQQQQQQPQPGVAGSAGATTPMLLQAQQQGLVKPGQPLLARPVWQGSIPRPEPATSSTPSFTNKAQPSSIKPTADAQAAPTTALASTAAAPAGPSSLWLSWLDCYYSASLPALLQYSCEDLVVAACTLATQQQVPPVTWYQQLLGSVQQRLPVLSTGQVSGLAWALARMALLPCRHNPGASLVPLQPWLGQLYERVDLSAQPQAAAVANTVEPYTLPVPDPGISPDMLAAAPAAAVAGKDGVAARLAAAGLVPGVQGVHVLSGGTSWSTSCVSAAELVRLMWAAGVCEYDPGDTWWAAAEQLLLRPQLVTSSSSRALSATATSSLSSVDSSDVQPAAQQVVVPAVSRLPARLLGALLQAYVSSGRQLPQDILNGVLTPATCQQLCCQPLMNTLRLLQGLVQSGSSIPQHWLQQLAVGLQHRLGRVTSWELGYLLLCLGDAGLQVQGMTGANSGAGSSNTTTTSSSSSQQENPDVGRSWTAEVTLACQSHLSEMTTRDVSMVLSAAAKLQLQLPPQMLQDLLCQMQLGFLGAPPAALAIAVNALTRLGVRPSRDWLGGFLMATHRSFTAAAATLSPGRSGSSSRVTGSIRARLCLVQSILQTLQGLARLKAAVPAKWLKQQLLLLHRQLPVLQPRHVATLLLLLARLGCRPSPMYLHSMLLHLGDCRTCSALDLVHIAHGIASLRWQPKQQWMELFLEASVDKLHVMSNQGLALLLWAVAVTQVVRPGRSWRREALRVVAARLGQFDSLQLSMVVMAMGRLPIHIMPLRSASPAHNRQQQQQDALTALQNSQRRRVQQLEAAGATAASSAGDSCTSASAVWPMSARQHERLLQGRHVAEQLLSAAMALRGQYNASQLAHLLAGVAKMRLGPNQVWLHGMVTQGSKEPLSALTGYQMQQLLWALARMRYRAPAAWLQTMALLLETRSMRHDSTRHSAMWALQQLHRLAHAPRVQLGNSSSSNE